MLPYRTLFWRHCPPSIQKVRSETSDPRTGGAKRPAVLGGSSGPRSGVVLGSTSIGQRAAGRLVARPNDASADTRQSSTDVLRRQRAPPFLAQACCQPHSLLNHALGKPLPADRGKPRNAHEAMQPSCGGATSQWRAPALAIGARAGSPVYRPAPDPPATRHS